jgi:sucrose-6-phosphate hydrolase SacC (GH32 family)
MPTEQFRPEYHFTPAQNWQNDPNGLFYYGGQYHLYFQHNPFGDQWGNMSWGHAVSHDLLTWHELPVAIPSGDTDWIFSGSLVVDENNTSGFGNGLDGQPPFVAIYTDANKLTPEQEQAIAYSHDGGLTFTKYEGNPVLDIADPEFRDPKVFWDDDAGHWTMVVARPLVRQVEFYSSTDLKSWDYLSSFGPQGATGGIWEVPDLIELPVDGDPNNTKHVLIVNLNPGSPYGGSGVQYFIGEWDGKTFTAENSPGLGGVPGDVFEDFEGTTYGTGWTTTGTAFGSGPAQGNLPGQTYVVLYEGEGLVNSFQNENASTGTLTSPTFTISSDYINLLVGGGEHAFTAGADDATAVNLVVNGEVVRTATGTDSDALDWTAWNVSEFAGEEAQIRIVDQNTGDWGHILVDQISFSDEAAQNSVERANWADYGSDFYAAISYNNLPDDQKTWIGWMSNWDYTRDSPTDPWRNAQSLPRDMSLVTVDGEVRLAQTPIEQVQDLRSGSGYHAANVNLSSGTLELGDPAAQGQALEIIATFDTDQGTADEFGVRVRVGNGQQTVVGYDRESGETFIDRSESGLSPGEGATSVHAAPLEPDSDGQVKLHIFVDRSSVELFANDGLRTITDVVFPDAESTGVQLYAEGGGVQLEELHIWQLDTADQTLDGTIRRDELTGTSSPELIRGYAGDDVLIGAPDDDTTAANDSYVGGPGSDVFFFDNLRRDLGNDTIQDLERTDTIRVTEQLAGGDGQIDIGADGIIDLNPDEPGTSTVDVGDGGSLRLVASTDVYYDYMLVA